MTDSTTTAFLLDLVEDDHSDASAAARLGPAREGLDGQQVALVEAMRHDRALLRSLETPPIPHDFVTRLLGEPVGVADQADQLEPIPLGADLPRWTASPPIRLRRVSRLPRLSSVVTSGLASVLGAPARFALAAGLGAALSAGLFMMSPGARDWAGHWAGQWSGSNPSDRATIVAGGDAGGSTLDGAPGRRLIATTDLGADADLHHGVPQRGIDPIGRALARAGTEEATTRTALPTNGGAGHAAHGAPLVSDIVLVMATADQAGTIELLRRACGSVAAEASGSPSRISLVRNVTYEEAMTSLRQALASSAADRVELDRLAQQREGARRNVRAGGATTPRDSERALYRELGERLASGAAEPRRPRLPSERGKTAAPPTLGEQLAGDESAAPPPELQLELADEGCSHALTIDAADLTRLLEHLARDGSLAAVRFEPRRGGGDFGEGAESAENSSITGDPWQAWKLASDAAHAAGRDAVRLIVPIRLTRVESRSR